MKILITAGGTSEKIDEVRSITNSSTGALGRAIAEAFLRIDTTEEILYVCGQTALTPPDSDRIRIFRITDTLSLQDTLRKILETERVDGIVHAMAVSDYTVDAVTNTDILKSQIAAALKEDRAEPGRIPELVGACLHKPNELTSSGKISSYMEDMILVLKKTPKIIDMFKVLQPQAILTGFKLLNNVSENALIETGLKLMKRSGCDLLFANDKTEVGKNRHCGYLIQSDTSYARFESREEIAGNIASSVARLVSNREN